MPAVRKAAASRSAVATPADEIAAFAGDPDFMTSLARGMAVMRAFTRSRRNLTVAELSRKTGLSRACVRRCLHTLRKLGYVDADDHVFSLRPKVLSLGYSYLSSAPLADIAQPLLERVSAAVQESSSLGVLDGDEVVYVARSATRRIMSVALNVGSRLPAYCTSLGRVALAALEADELRGYFTRARSPRRASSPSASARRAPTASRSWTRSSRSACARSPCRCATPRAAWSQR
jgi:IclR family pca regulon transcriptional regulator